MMSTKPLPISVGCGRKLWKHDHLIADLTFVDIDRGTGSDTLRFDGSNLSFDFSAIFSPRLSSIKIINFTGSGDNSLALSALDLFLLSDDTIGGFTRLAVLGEAGDSVATLDAGWASAGTAVIGADTFNFFQKGQAQPIIHDDIATGGILI